MDLQKSHLNASFTSDARTYVERMEYLTELPTGFPVPRVRTPFVVNLSDPKSDIFDEDAYRKAVQAVGLIGTTVAKVDNALLLSSTRLLLGGQRPGQYAPALYSKRIKQDMIAREKKKYPAGLGIAGAYDLYRQDLDKPLAERYIHRFQHAPDGGLITFTCFTALLSLLDDPGVKTFEDDTTFKRIEGDVNEWEVVIFYNPLGTWSVLPLASLLL
ncbi:hypothetical protein B0H16DRAFT_1718490 [Mycena metata]|uniref:Uncharacterized protein n=1 Tax=Mycena metata TaxID=1033252 RepID=A0AAD7HPY4_9AGAR|nr:hypothetical protein B0H16DRAFT_1736048 [Mycena metata]KAJ7763854.1 hypothetical protein B0H16DRAFT_1718490 [Mycena metata]